jgi:hypothetical protein
MSMLAKYGGISPSLATCLREHPVFVRAVIAADKTGNAANGLAESLRALPPEIREEMMRQPELRAQLEEAERESALLGPGARDAWTAIEAAGLGKADVREEVDLDKAWHGLHFVLTGAAWDVAAPPGNAVLGGTPLGTDLGYGPARLMDADDVRRTALALDALSEDQIRRQFDPEALLGANIYGGDWADAEEVEWIVAAFHKATRCFVDSAARGDALLLYIR